MQRVRGDEIEIHNTNHPQQQPNKKSETTQDLSDKRPLRSSMLGTNLAGFGLVEVVAELVQALKQAIARHGTAALQSPPPVQTTPSKMP